MDIGRGEPAEEFLVLPKGEQPGLSRAPINTGLSKQAAFLVLLLFSGGGRRGRGVRVPLLHQPAVERTGKDQMTQVGWKAIGPVEPMAKHSEVIDNVRLL